MYREEHGVSMDWVANKCNISKAYVSLLEKNRHPKTGKAIVPSIQTIRLVSDGLGIEFNKLFCMIDGDIDLSDGYYVNPHAADEAQEIYERDRILFDAAKDATPEQIRQAADYLNFLKSTSHDG